MLGLQLFIMVVCGVIAAAIASSKGRSVVGWFFGGALIGVIGIIIVACLSNVKQERAHREQMESEHRRLREQLRQERIKSESYRQHSLGRLDAHDRILGVDTRSASALPGGDGPRLALPSPPPEALAADGRATTPEEALARMAAQPSADPPAAVGNSSPVPPVQEIDWYYEMGGRPIGPVAEHDIRRLLQEGRIDGKTLLWCEDLGQWTSAMHVEAFRSEAIS